MERTPICLSTNDENDGARIVPCSLSGTWIEHGPGKLPGMASMYRVSVLPSHTHSDGPSGTLTLRLVLNLEPSCRLATTGILVAMHSVSRVNEGIVALPSEMDLTVSGADPRCIKHQECTPAILPLSGSLIMPCRMTLL
jgi:hypothetical protein